jgi:hypothetical protein
MKRGIGFFTDPSQFARLFMPELLIGLVFLVEPILRSGQILGPIAQVDISPPRLRIGGLPVSIGRVPGEISIALPGAPILLTHTSSSSQLGGHRLAL